MLGRPHLESELLVDNALLIVQLQKEIDDYPEHACCSCECLHQRKAVTRVKLSENFRSESEVWSSLKSYIAEQSPNAGDQVLYVHVQLLQTADQEKCLATLLRPQWIAHGPHTRRTCSIRLFEYCIYANKTVDKKIISKFTFVKLDS